MPAKGGPHRKRELLYLRLLFRCGFFERTIITRSLSISQTFEVLQQFPLELSFWPIGPTPGGYGKMIVHLADVQLIIRFTRHWIHYGYLPCDRVPLWRD
jgi:hypothetical protein